jgi:AAHS family 4-hydroxybenzoate transporter-like MFS transporter
MAQNVRNTINVTEIVDNSPFTPLHWRSFTLCMACLVMDGFDVQVLGYTAPSIVREWGVPAATLGPVFAAANFGVLLGALFISMLADRIGRRPPILLALATVVGANIAYLLANDVTLFVTSRFVVGVLSAGLLPAAMAVVGDIMPADQRARWSGTLMGGYGVGFIFGPTLGGVLYDQFGFVAPFAVSAGLGLVGLVFAAVLVPETRPSRPRPGSALRTTAPRLGALVAVPRPLAIFLVLLVLDFVSVFLFAFVEPQLAFYLYDNLGFSTAAFGVLVGAYGLALVLGQSALGRVADRVGRRLPIALGMLVSSSFYLGLVTLRDLNWLIVTTLLAGLGTALAGPALSAAYLDITDEADRSRVMGLKGAAAALGGVAGPLLVAIASRWLPPQGIFAISALMALVAAGLAVTVLRDAPRTPARWVPHAARRDAAVP